MGAIKDGGSVSRWLSAAIAVTALALAAGGAGRTPVAAQSRPHDRLEPAGLFGASTKPVPERSGTATIRVAAASGGCGTVRLGQTTVATLRNAPIVTLLANGMPVTMLLDTGAETTILTPGVAQRLGAQRPQIEFNRQLRGVAGSMQTNEVELHSFTIGGVAIPWRRVRVAPITVASVFSGPLDGILGADSLNSFDIDLDLPNNRITFYTRQICPGTAPAWTEPYTTIAAGRSKGDHLFFPVQLDGRKISAFIDTGAQSTVLSTSAALAMGLTPVLLARDRAAILRGAGPEQLTGRVHRFARLEIGGEAIRNSEIIVADLNLSDADLVLGIDIVRPWRIWLSYGAQKIFLLRRI
jgi:predicted aspartyl protease